MAEISFLHTTKIINNTDTYLLFRRILPIPHCTRLAPFTPARTFCSLEYFHYPADNDPSYQYQYYPHYKVLHYYPHPNHDPRDVIP